MKNNTYLLLALITVVGAFLRLYNLNWDFGHYLHPDERLYTNASNIYFPDNITDFFSPASPLNPKMFYYGSFPLYLYKFIQSALLPWISFTIVSRLIASLFSIATIPLIFFLCKKLFDSKTSLLAALFTAFSPGLIQHAHFNTTESILVFLITLITFLSLQILAQHRYIYFLTIALGVLIGMSYAVKITGLTFIVIPFVSFIFVFFQQRKYHKLLLLIAFFNAMIFAGIILAPYQIIDYKTFLEQQSYMQDAIYGKVKPPFVIIYEKTTPYIYPLVNILPFSFGFLSFPLSVAGLLLLMKKFWHGEKEQQKYFFILFYPIIYFAIAGGWYAKFSRYYILLFPFLSIWAAYALQHLRKPLIFIASATVVINGIFFLRIYTQPHTRIAASEWIYANIPNNGKLLGEHWDDSLPLPLATLSKNYNQSQLTVYDLPDSQEKINKFSEELANSDYFIISSRRVYHSILQNKEQYPFTSKMYQKLFKGELGYQLIKTFTNYPFYFSDDFADESFQSYDHPPVYIYKNANKLSSFTIGQEIIKNE